MFSFLRKFICIKETWKATETVCQAFYNILRSIKTRFTQGPFFCALGPLFCALVREEAIFAVCKRCANEGFACVRKKKNSEIKLVSRYFKNSEISVVRYFGVPNSDPHPYEHLIINSFFFTHACKTLVCAPFTDSKNGLFSHQCAK